MLTRGDCDITSIWLGDEMTKIQMRREKLPNPLESEHSATPFRLNSIMDSSRRIAPGVKILEGQLRLPRGTRSPRASVSLPPPFGRCKLFRFTGIHSIECDAVEVEELATTSIKESAPSMQNPLPTFNPAPGSF